MRPPTRTPGSIAVAMVIGLMFVTPVLAATSLRPLTIRWNVLFEFVSAHQLGLIVGFSLMIVIAVLLKAASGHASPRSDLLLMPETTASGLDGLA